MAPSTGRPATRRTAAGRQYRLLRLALAVIRLGPVLILAGLIVAMTLLSPVFLTTRNVGNVLAQTAVIAVLAMGQLLVILTRGIDLSVGSTLALASVVGALVFGSDHGGVVVIVAMLATGPRSARQRLGLRLRPAAPPVHHHAGHAQHRPRSGAALSGGQPKRGMPESVTLGGGSIGWFPYSAFLVAGLALPSPSCCRALVLGRWIYAVGR